MASIAAAEDNVAQGVYNNKMVVLPVSVKDPERAFSLSLMPITGPFAAHRYLSSSPIRWDDNIPEVHGYAVLTSFLNIVTIAGGMYLMSTANEEVTKTESYTYYESNWNGYTYVPTPVNYSFSYKDYELNNTKLYGGLALLVIGPIIENVIFGNYCAHQAVDYNKRLYKQFNYSGEPFSLQFKASPGKAMFVMAKRF